MFKSQNETRHPLVVFLGLNFSFTVRSLPHLQTSNIKYENTITRYRKNFKVSWMLSLELRYEVLQQAGRAGSKSGARDLARTIRGHPWTGLTCTCKRTHVESVECELVAPGTRPVILLDTNFRWVRCRDNILPLYTTLGFSHFHQRNAQFHLFRLTFSDLTSAHLRF